ncbi:MAG: type VI secretion system-associated protein TagF [Ignavibacteriae bacterium]|nr:type VI secretion system-associated protein TagF [Ignavibacteriota bacterium]NOG96791.1 type VI secretion system-associated protein TagF [Ignavibacteriota bacterium]
MINIKYSPGCFGKLPKFADFVKFNSGNSELLFFDKWLQNGLQFARNKLNAEFETAYNNAAPIQFVFPIPNSSNILLGSFTSSNDKSGRKYPFIISTSINFSFENDLVNVIPLAFQDFYLNSEKLFSTIKEKEKLDEVISSVENHFPFNEAGVSHKQTEYQEYRNATTTNKLWNRLFGSFDDERKYLLIYNLTEILLPLKNKPLNNFTLGLKIPVVNEKEFLFPNISFWIEVCLKLIGSKNILPYLFWSSDSLNNETYLTLFLTQPPADNYAQLINPNYLMDNICLTEKEGKMESCMQYMDQKYKSLLAEKELTLTDFLKNI